MTAKLKGFRKVVATSPFGAIEAIEGDALELAQQTPCSTHWSIHERQEDGSLGPLRAVIPKDWAIRAELNQ